MNLKFWQRKSNAERVLEVSEAQLGELLELTAGVPGATLRERIINLLPPAPVLQEKTPPAPMQQIEAVTAARY